ncbi:MAG TPA: hypothetical protein PK156_32630 [Polyangium sp.]|nr:hypothetical protein [Polyangium sp.]
MHTPGHVILNLTLLGSVFGHEGAIIAGAIVPDLPIFILYLYERARKTPPEVIWSVCYQHKHWLAIIHGAHSIPFALLGMLGGLVLHQPAIILFFTSVLAHASCDFPLHAIDAHRHFFPLSEYRFISPISYWDVRYHGRTIAKIEAGLVLACSIYLYFIMGPRWSSLPSPVLATLLVVTNLWYGQNYFRNVAHA